MGGGGSKEFSCTLNPAALSHSRMQVLMYLHYMLSVLNNIKNKKLNITSKDESYQYTINPNIDKLLDYPEYKACLANLEQNIELFQRYNEIIQNIVPNADVTKSIKDTRIEELIQKVSPTLEAFTNDIFNSSNYVPVTIPVPVYNKIDLSIDENAKALQEQMNTINRGANVERNY
jgi:hypothetical protein